MKVAEIYTKDKDGNISKSNVIKGESAYASAVIGGYQKSEEEFYQDLGKMATTDDVEKVDDKVKEIDKKFDTRVNELLGKMATTDDIENVKTEIGQTVSELSSEVDDKVSKDGLKTINGQSIVGEGDIEIIGVGSDTNGGSFDGNIYDDLSELIADGDGGNLSDGDVAGAKSIYTLVKTSGGASNYSTVERVIGTWIDGKPLYQSVVTLSNISIPSGLNSYALDSIVNAKQVTRYDVFLETLSDGNIQTPTHYLFVNGYQSYSWDTYINYSANPDNDNKMDVSFMVGAYARPNVTVTIIVEYTKSTD